MYVFIKYLCACASQREGEAGGGRRALGGGGDCVGSHLSMFGGMTHTLVKRDTFTCCAGNQINYGYRSTTKGQKYNKIANNIAYLIF